MKVSQEEVEKLISLLTWYVHNDDVNENDSENEYWTSHKRKAINLIAVLDMRKVHGNWGNMSFGEALTKLKAGSRMARLGWNGKGMWIELQRPDANSKMTLPYIYMSTADGQKVPWLASQSDLLSEDWVLVVPHEP